GLSFPWPANARPLKPPASVDLLDFRDGSERPESASSAWWESRPRSLGLPAITILTFVISNRGIWNGYEQYAKQQQPRSTGPGRNQGPDCDHRRDRRHVQGGECYAGRTSADWRRLCNDICSGRCRFRPCSGRLGWT